MHAPFYLWGDGSFWWITYPCTPWFLFSFSFRFPIARPDMHVSFPPGIQVYTNWMNTSYLYVWIKISRLENRILVIFAIYIAGFSHKKNSMMTNLVISTYLLFFVIHYFYPYRVCKIKIFIKIELEILKVFRKDVKTCWFLWLMKQL